jgi:poly(3-hydroxybutyrate) depolymerase
MNDGFQVTFLGSYQREAFAQVKTHLMPENRQRARAGTVFFAIAMVTYVTHQIEILFHE